MGRRSHTRALSIWANGERVGTWILPANGAMELRYTESWKQSAVGRPLSLSLPFGVDDLPLRGERVENYFDNLLPDSPDIRKRIAARFKTQTLEAFDLLKAIGRDCVGAVQLLDEDETPSNVDRIEGTPLSADDIERILQRMLGSEPIWPTDDEDDFRISLAGAQEKTALLYRDGQWLLPRGATPTTHILKLPLGLLGRKKVDFQISVENEWLCLAVLDAYGLPVPKADVMTFGSQKVLCVERFDRTYGRNGALLRLPQEDFCQALGVSPHRKYEAHGGPGIREIAGILQQSQRASEDISNFLRAHILYWMLAAPDGHAKNFSLRLLPGGRFQMTPLYDVMSIWPVEGDGGNQWSWHKASLAMAVWGTGRHYRMRDIKRSHFNQTARLCRYGPNAEPLIAEILQRTPQVIESVSGALPPRFPERVAERIFNGLREAAERLQSMEPAQGD
ncbi:type II toxin-antitoxin system HipA family toxin [Trinickia acidisoli]|uniref:type II toxin-antitoxin system HipA family toxin n=1 Tax=Trinickia acidisoli TaxID=2767482 RepID=UPI001A8E39C4|nr:type II toxin-antitoxin system HipA family toxin [Trinickia acidisoli]